MLYNDNCCQVLETGAAQCSGPIQWKQLQLFLTFTQFALFLHATPFYQVIFSLSNLHVWLSILHYRFKDHWLLFAPWNQIVS